MGKPPGSLPPIWNVPYLRSANFSGRESVLRSLEAAVRSGQPAALRQAIAGLGGVGKTQIAVEYAYRHLQDYEVVWWLRADDPVTLASDYATLSVPLVLPEKAGSDQSVIIQAVRRWLGQNTRWLLIFDNALALKDVRDYLPQGQTGHTLITSQNPNWGMVAKRHIVKTWSVKEAGEFLLKRTGQNDKQAARKLAELLDGLPLALEQAGAYIEASQETLDGYTNLFQAEQLRLFDAETTPAPDDYNATVRTTWKVAFENVRTVPLASDVLNICAYLAPDGIPRNDLLRWISPDGRLAFNKAIEAVARYSLVASTDESLSIHQLVQAVIRDELRHAGNAEWAQKAIIAIAHDFPCPDYPNWKQCELLLPHARYCCVYIADMGLYGEPIALFLNDVGTYLQQRAQYTDAANLLRAALAMSRHIFGNADQHVEMAVHNLGFLLVESGQYEEAIPLLKEAIALGERHGAQESPHFSKHLDCLAGAYQFLHRYKEAMSLMEQALEILRHAKDVEPTAIAVRQSNLAVLYSEVGRLVEAEHLLKNTLEIDRDTIGESHPNYASHVINLAVVYMRMERQTDAETALLEASAVIEGAFDAEHHSMAYCHFYLGQVLLAQGRALESRTHLRSAFELFERTLGSQHPQTIACRTWVEQHAD